VSAIPPSFTLHFHERLGSTSDEAKTLAEHGAPDGTVIVAREQTAGRGRLNRVWFSPEGNLFMSAILRPAVAPAHAAELGFLGAVAVAEAVENCLPHTASIRLKWPNDVLVNGAKVAGVLLESQLGRLDVRWIVLGIGLNVLHRPEDAPYPATSLTLAGAQQTAETMLPLVLQRLSTWRELWRRHGFAPVRAEWLRRGHAWGEVLEVRIGGSLVRGRFAGLDDDGALLLETPGGGQRITAGDVAFAPPVASCRS
jgi:BirA family transcriptional regulator, biotin operon repressor / biotin---[acetyl-CoA-carboxylase] ligase